MQSGSPIKKKKNPYGAKAQNSKSYRSARTSGRAMKDVVKRSQRASNNRSPQLMDWIMLDNSVKPIQEHKRQAHLAPLHPEHGDQMRDFARSSTSPTQMTRSRFTRNRKIPNNFSLVNPSKEGSIDLQVKINQQTLQQLAQMQNMQNMMSYRGSKD